MSGTLASKHLVEESKHSNSLTNSFLCSLTHSFPPVECEWVGPTVGSLAGEGPAPKGGGCWVNGSRMNEEE